MREDGIGAGPRSTGTGKDRADQPAEQAQAQHTEADRRPDRAKVAQAMRPRTPSVKIHRRFSICMH